MTFKQDVVAHFAAHGFPLREVECESNYIEYCFRVGPEFEFGVGMNVIETAEERERFQPQEYSIPSHTRHDVVLWQWNLEGSNASEEYVTVYEQLKAVLDSYPGRPAGAH